MASAPHEFLCIICPMKGVHPKLRSHWVCVRECKKHRRRQKIIREPMPSYGYINNSLHTINTKVTTNDWFGSVLKRLLLSNHRLVGSFRKHACANEKSWVGDAGRAHKRGVVFLFWPVLYNDTRRDEGYSGEFLRNMEHAVYLRRAFGAACWGSFSIRVFTYQQKTIQFNFNQY